MTPDQDTNTAIVKIMAAWMGVMFGGITLSGLVLTATLVFTVLQIFVLVRRIWKGQA